MDYKKELKRGWAVQAAKRKIKEDHDARCYEEAKDLVGLLLKYNRWQQSRQISEYMLALENKTRNENKYTEEFKNWLTRAQEKADWFDPLIERPDLWLGDFDHDQIINKLTTTNS